MNRLFDNYFRRSVIFKRVLFLGVFGVGLTSFSTVLNFYNNCLEKRHLLKTSEKHRKNKKVVAKPIRYKNTDSLKCQLFSKRDIVKNNSKVSDVCSQHPVVTQYLSCAASKKEVDCLISSTTQPGSDSAQSKQAVGDPAIIEDNLSPLLNTRRSLSTAVSQRETSTSIISSCRWWQDNVIYWDYAALFQSPVSSVQSRQGHSLTPDKRKQNSRGNQQLNCNCCRLCSQNSKQGDYAISQSTVDRNTNIVFSSTVASPQFAVDFILSKLRNFFLVNVSISFPKSFLVSDKLLPFSTISFFKPGEHNFRFFAFGMSDDELDCAQNSEPFDSTDWPHKSESRYKTMESTLQQMKKDIGSLSSKLKQNPNYLESTNLTYSLPVTTFDESQDSATVASNIKEDLNRLSSRLKGADTHGEEQLPTISIQKGCSKESNLSDSGFGSNDALQHDSTSPIDSTHYSPMLTESAYSEDEEDFVEDELIATNGQHQPVSKNWQSPSDYSGYNPFDKNYPELSDRTRDLLAKIRQGRPLSDSSISPPPGSPTMDDLELEEMSLEDFIINTDDMLTFPMRPAQGSQFGSMRSLPPIVEEHPEECLSSGSENEDEENVNKTGEQSLDDDESEAESFITVKSVNDSETNLDDENETICGEGSPKAAHVGIEHSRLEPAPYDPFDCCDSSSDSGGEGTPQTSVTHEDFRVIMESGSRAIPLPEPVDDIFNADQQTEQDLSSPSNSEASWPSTGTPSEDQEASTFDQENNDVSIGEAEKYDPNQEKTTDYVDNDYNTSLREIEERRRTIDNYRTLLDVKTPDIKRLSNESEESDGILCSSEYDSDSEEEFDAAGAIERQHIRERLKTVDDSALHLKSQFHQVGIFQPPLPRPSSLYRPKQSRRRLYRKEKDLSIIEELPDNVDKSDNFQSNLEEGQPEILLVDSNAYPETVLVDKQNELTDGEEQTNSDRKREAIDFSDLAVKNTDSTEVQSLTNSVDSDSSFKNPNQRLTHCSRATLHLKNWGVSPQSSAEDFNLYKSDSEEPSPIRASVRSLSSHFEAFSSPRKENPGHSMALRSNNKDANFVDSETGEDRGYQKTLVPVGGSTVAQSRGSVTAVASSRALVKKGGSDNGSGGYPTAQAMAKAEASASSPGVAAARATAKAASIASETATKGGGRGDDNEDIHIYISTSCTIRRNRKAATLPTVASKEDVESGMLLAISRNSLGDSESESATSPGTITESIHFEQDSRKQRPKENVLSLLHGDHNLRVHKVSQHRSSLTCELPSPGDSGGRDAVENAAFDAIKTSFPTSDNVAYEVSRNLADRLIKETPLRKSAQDLRFSEFRKTLDSLQSRHEERIQKRTGSQETTHIPKCITEMDDLKFDRVPQGDSTHIEEAYIPSSGSSSNGSENWKRPLTISVDAVDNYSINPRGSDRTPRSKIEYNSVLNTPVDYSQKSSSPQYILSEKRVLHQDLDDKQKERRDEFFKTSPPDYTHIDQFSSLPVQRSQKPEQLRPSKIERNYENPTKIHLKSVPDDDTVRFQSLQYHKNRRRFKSTDIDSAITQGSMHDITQATNPQEPTYHLHAYDTSPGKYKSMSLFDLTTSSSLRRTPSNPALVFFSDAKSTTTLYETDIDTGEIKDQTVVLETNVDHVLSEGRDIQSKAQSMVNLHTTSGPQSLMKVFDFDDGGLNRAQSMDLCNDNTDLDFKNKNTHGLIERLQDKAKSTNELRVADSLRKLYVPEWLDSADPKEPNYLLESEKDHPDGFLSVPRSTRKSINPPKHAVVIPTRVSLSKSTPSLVNAEFGSAHVELPSRKLKTTPSLREKLKPIDSKLKNVMSSVKNSTEPSGYSEDSQKMPGRRSILKSLPSNEEEESFNIVLEPSDFLPKNQITTTTKITTKFDEVREDILFTRTSKFSTLSDSSPPPKVPESSLKKQSYRSIITVATESLQPNNPTLLPSMPKLKSASSADSIHFIDDHASLSSDTESMYGAKSLKHQVNGAVLRARVSDVADGGKQNIKKCAQPRKTNMESNVIRRPSVSSRSSIEHEDSDSENETNNETEILNVLFRRSEARLLKLRDSFDLATFFKNANYSLTSGKCSASVSPYVTCDDLILESMATGRANLREFYVDQDNVTLQQNENVGVIRLLCGSALCQKEEALVRGRETDFVSCYNCYTYYCSARCRSKDLSRHDEMCTFGRSKRMCSQLLKSLTQDQIQSFSNFAIANFDIHGRGSIFLAFESYAIAKKFMMGEKNTLIGPPLYLSTDELFKFDAAIATPCKNYNTEHSFVLSVVICASSTIENAPTKLFKQCIVLPLLRPVDTNPEFSSYSVLKENIVKTTSEPTRPLQDKQSDSPSPFKPRDSTHDAFVLRQQKSRMPFSQSEIKENIVEPIREQPPPCSLTKPGNSIRNMPSNMALSASPSKEDSVKAGNIQPPPLPDKPPVTYKKPPPPPYNQAVSMTTVTTAPRPLQKTTIIPSKPPSVIVPPKLPPKSHSATPSSSESETESESSYSSSSSYESVSPPPPKPRKPTAITPANKQPPPKPEINSANSRLPPTPQRRTQPFTQTESPNRNSLKKENRNDQFSSLSSQTVPLPPRPQPVKQLHSRSEMYDLSSKSAVPPPIPRKRNIQPTVPQGKSVTSSVEAIASPVLPPPAAYASKPNTGTRPPPPKYSSLLASKTKRDSNRTPSISKEEREVYFARIQRFMRDRGVSLRSQFPQIFDHLIQFVEVGRIFPPVNFYYVDPQLRTNVICTLRPFCDPVITPSQPVRKPTIETDL